MNRKTQSPGLRFISPIFLFLACRSKNKRYVELTHPVLRLAANYFIPAIAGPLALARDILGKDDSPFFVLNSDVICDFPFEKLKAFHEAHGDEGTIVVSRKGLLNATVNTRQRHRWTDRETMIVTNLSISIMAWFSIKQI